ncbi:transposase, Ptta/En/Spm [Artemisia annua]|uniref:Transposase, Ptta/En/Spm n=1 Tax=Artemisia annua TaxID=35608 RepID=A0A2U1PW71_ARTAN|nr:transposase, Ptta/En/Spm [Artemisia annua]
MFNGSWTTWNEVNRFAHDELWALFKVWEDSMRKLYPGLMSQAKDESIKMAQLTGVEFDGSDFSVLKPYNPEWIKSIYWEDMIDRVWNTKSKLPKHCGGSVAFSLLRRRLESQLHISGTPAEIFELTHTKKGVRNRGYGI